MADEKQAENIQKIILKDDGKEEEEDKSKNSSKKGRFFLNKRGGNTDPTTANSLKQPNMESDKATIGGEGEEEEERKQCEHAIIIKDMCGNCGKDLREKGAFSGHRIEHTVASVSMIHHVPELVVSNEIANEIGTRDHENILRRRKLILLVDLDQTLVHTSDRPPKPSEVGSSEMFGYQLYGTTFFTKIRPHTRHFLERLNQLYEMHIVTYGQRMYAHKIAELLDPNKIYFDYRILSRDELLSSIHKSGNLKALFPCSEQLVLMLDDRPDVWMHSEALIRVRPYRFFTEVGDINAPPEDLGTSKKGAPLEKAEIGLKMADEGAGDPPADANANKSSSASSPPIGPASKGEEQQLSRPIPPVSDDDNALEYVERILVQVHSLFYQQFERDKRVPDVKRIVGWLKSQVLAGERVVFSGVVPLGVDIRACEIYRLCTQFGAKVDDKVVEGQTTVLIAAKAATEKMRQASRLRIPIVGTRWLDVCFERWQKLDKRDFLFIEEEEEEENSPSKGQAKESAANREEATTHQRRSWNHGGEQREELGEGPSFAAQGGEGDVGPIKRARLSSDSLGMDRKTLLEMEDEVASALSEEGESNEEEEEEKEGSGESSLDGLEGGAEEPGECSHGKAWEDRLAGGGEELEEEDEENNRFDYGDEEEADEDVGLDEEENELYDEMAADIEQQLNNDNERHGTEAEEKRKQQ